MLITGSFTDSLDADPSFDTLNFESDLNFKTFTSKWGECTPSFSTTTAESFCDPYTSSSGTVYTNSGNYAEIFQNTTGCDSIVTIQLTVHQEYDTSFSAGICAGETYLFDGMSLDSSGLYNALFTTIYGCDSVITLNLIVYPTSTNSINQLICAGETYLFNGTNYSIAGTYIETFQTIHGCDSVVTLNLSVNPTSFFEQTVEICSGESVLFNGVNYTTSGDYTVVLENSNGCDSTDVLHLTVRPNFSSTTLTQICNGDSFFFEGTSYSSAGFYTVHYTSMYGCDSTLSLTLSIETVEVGVIQLDDTTLSAQATGVGYSWLDCNGAFVALGETNQQFSANLNGQYAVEITQNGCVDTSTCFSTTSVGITELSDDNWTIFPNPTADFFHLSVPMEYIGKQVFIQDNLGRKVAEISITSDVMTIDASLWQEGIYYVHVEDVTSPASRILISRLN